jgi:DNA-binding XRE family transcriptional regulator
MAAPDSSRGRPRPARSVRPPPKHDPSRLPPRATIARAFGAALRELRNARGLTQEDLATAAGLDRTYPSLLERGVRTPTLLVVERLARALDLPASQLIEKFEAALQSPPLSPPTP